MPEVGGRWRPADAGDGGSWGGGHGVTSRLSALAMSEAEVGREDEPRASHAGAHLIPYVVRSQSSD